MKFLKLLFLIYLSSSVIALANELKPWPVEKSGRDNGSFNCNKAKTVIENAICTNVELGELDKQLNNIFNNLKKRNNEILNVSVKELIADQKKWLQERDNDKNCQDSECLISKYKNRITMLSFPGAPKNLNQNKIKELENYFKDKSCEIFEIFNDKGLFKTEGLDIFACKIYETNPQLGNKLFSNCYGSNRDNFVPYCRTTNDDVKKIDGLKEYLDLLTAISGINADSGTLRYGKYKIQLSATLLALHDTHISIADINQSLSSPGGDSNKLYQFTRQVDLELNPDYKNFKKTKEGYIYPPLLHYSWKGLWEQDQYKKYLELRERAIKGLEKYYINIKKTPADEAKRAAEFHVLNLVNIYIGSSYSRRDNWGLNDLDDFLKTGILPDDLDYNYTTILYNDERDNVTKKDATPDILSYFLRMAIVNNYSRKDIEKIISAGAKINGSNIADDALMNSVRRPDILQLLIEKGVNVNAENSFGKTPLMYAIQFGNLEAVKILINNHADINHLIPNNKRTPLMYAAWHANENVMKYLLEKGANPDAKDSDGNDYKFYLKMNDWSK